jgi:hypothetical protein
MVCVVLFAVSAIGCSKTPEKICDRFAELEAKSAKEKSQEGERAKCVQDLAKMKETSPEAYNCVAGCADQSTQEAAAGCTFACVLSDPKLKEAEKKQEDAVNDASAAGSKELAKVVDQPVKPIKGKMMTFDDKPFSFSLALAEGFTEDASMATDTIRSWDVKIPGLLTGPNVTLMPTLAPDFERDVKQAAELKETVVKKEKTDKGHVLITENKGMLKAEVVVTAGARAVSCKASLYDETAAQQKDKYLPWLEKMCRSLAVE